MAKCEVNGPGAQEAYKYLRDRSSLRGREISWNFEKFLLDKKGQVVKHYGPRVLLEDMQDEIEKILLDDIAKERESNGPKKVKQL